MGKWRLDAGQIEVIDDVVAVALAGKTPAEKIEMVLEANRTARQLLSSTLRSRHPDWNDKMVNREVARRLLGGAD